MGDAAGQLRIYHEDRKSRSEASSEGPLNCISDGVGRSEEANVDESSYTDVFPRGGTLVVFDSRRMEHQVFPTREDRFALTSWIAGEPGLAVAAPNSSKDRK